MVGSLQGQSGTRVSGLPQRDSPVVAAGGQQRTVGSERQGKALPGIVEAEDLLAGCRIDPPDRLVVARGHHVPAERVERDGQDGVLVPLEDMTELTAAAFQIRTVRSELAEARSRPSGEKATARTLSSCPFKTSDGPAGAKVPDPHRSIEPGARELSAVGADGHPGHQRVVCPWSVFVSAPDRGSQILIW